MLNEGNYTRLYGAVMSLMLGLTGLAPQEMAWAMAKSLTPTSARLLSGKVLARRLLLSVSKAIAGMKE